MATCRHTKHENVIARAQPEAISVDALNITRRLLRLHDFVMNGLAMTREDAYFRENTDSYSFRRVSSHLHQKSA